jgi:O-antigen/teichoic acid export membrane protein
MWYGLDLVASIVAAFATSLPLARVIGPHNLGYFNYVAWLTTISSVVGTLGIPGAARKYMAEYLNKGEGGIARAVFFSALRLQFYLACGVTVVSLIVVFVASDPAYHWISAFLVLSMLPGMFVSIPSSANMAAENMRANTIASLASYAVHISAVALSLSLGWNLLGVAIGVFAFRSVDCFIKLWYVLKWIRPLPVIPLPASLRKKLISFSSYNLALMTLNMVVWDRSDVVFLKALSTDVAQISLYTVAFNLVDKIRLLPNAIGTGMGSSIQAQYGRDAGRLPQITSAALWYTFLSGLPLLAGMAAMSYPLINLLYGRAYLPAVPVLAVGALLAIPKCYLPAWNLLEAMEKQKFLVVWMSLSAAVNVLLDILLIPGHGALGAAVANGLAQFMAVIGVIWRASSLCKLPLRLASVVRALVAVGAMGLAIVALSIFPIGPLKSGWVLVPLQMLVGAIVLLVALRVTAVFNLEDSSRLRVLAGSLPGPLRNLFSSSVTFLIPGGAPRLEPEVAPLRG